MTDAVLGAGTEFKLGDGAQPEVYTKVAEVLRIGPVGSTAPEVDTTSLDSTSKEYISDLPDGEVVDFQFNYIKGNTQQQALRDARGTTKSIQIVWSDTSTATFDLVILGFSRDETTPSGQLTASVSGRITGDITWA